MCLITVFVGYSSTKPGCWMFYEPGKRTFIESSQVVFDENSMPGLGGGTVCLDSIPEAIARGQLFKDPELEVAKITGPGNPAGFCTHTRLGSGMGWATRPKATRGNPCGSHHPIITSHFLVIMYNLCNIQPSK